MTSEPIRLPDQDHVCGFLHVNIPVDLGEQLAKILFRFDALIADPDELDFEYDRQQWAHFAIDMLKAKAFDDVRRTGSPDPAHAQLLTAADIAAADQARASVADLGSRRSRGWWRR